MTDTLHEDLCTCVTTYVNGVTAVSFDDNH